MESASRISIIRGLLKIASVHILRRNSGIKLENMVNFWRGCGVVVSLGGAGVPELDVGVGSIIFLGRWETTEESIVSLAFLKY